MPSKLKPGSKIEIVAPAGRIYRSELDFALNWIEENQWEAVFSDELFREYNFGYFYAGRDEHRLKLVQDALNHPEIDAIWFARGGYGSVRLIDQLDFTHFMKNPKWLIGYSDVTVFHNYLNNQNIPTIHAVTAKRLKTEYAPATYDSLQNILLGNELKYVFPTTEMDVQGSAQGNLVGGNLSMIYSQLGSRTALCGNNLILFIEDWNENWYHLDRMLMALKRSGLFERIKALIVGSFTQMDTREDNPNFVEEFDPTSFEIIKSFVESFKIPVMFGFPAGHIGDNRALILGREISFTVGEEFIRLEYVH